MPKMTNKWIALCTTAVGVVYGAGYVVTQSTMTQSSVASAQTVTATPAQSNNTQNQQPSNGSSSSSKPKAYYGGHDGRFGDGGHHHDFHGDGGEFSLIMGAEMGQRMDRAPALPILQLEIQGQRILDPRPTPPRQPLIKTGLIRGLV